MVPLSYLVFNVASFLKGSKSPVFFFKYEQITIIYISWLFHSHKLHLLAALGLFTDRNDRFPNFSFTVAGVPLSQSPFPPLPNMPCTPATQAPRYDFFYRLSNLSQHVSNCVILNVIKLKRSYILSGRIVVLRGSKTMVVVLFWLGSMLDLVFL